MVVCSGIYVVKDRGGGFTPPSDLTFPGGDKLTYMPKQGNWAHPMTHCSTVVHQCIQEYKINK